MINKLRALIDKVDSMHARTDRQCYQRGRKPKEGPKRNIRDQEHRNQNEGCL